MADLDVTAGVNATVDQPPAEEDPAAEFLAREQTELAGLEDENVAGQTAETDNFDPFGGAVDEAEPPVQNSLSSGGLEDFEVVKTEDVTNIIEDQQPAVNGPSDVYAALSEQSVFREEPEKIRVWKQEQESRLTDKDEAEEKQKTEWLTSAKKELDDWYKHHQEQLEKTKDNNRAAENAFVKDRDESLPGHEWEKICRLCEFNPKNSKNTKDVSRMRSILLQLKQTPLIR